MPLPSRPSTAIPLWIARRSASPDVLITSEADVMRWLVDNPDGRAWEVQLDRVEAVKIALGYPDRPQAG